MAATAPSVANERSGRRSADGSLRSINALPLARSSRTATRSRFASIPAWRSPSPPPPDPPGAESGGASSSPFIPAASGRSGSLNREPIAFIPRRFRARRFRFRDSCKLPRKAAGHALPDGIFWRIEKIPATFSLSETFGGKPPPPSQAQRRRSAAREHYRNGLADESRRRTPRRSCAVSAFENFARRPVGIQPSGAKNGVGCAEADETRCAAAFDARPTSLRWPRLPLSGHGSTGRRSRHSAIVPLRAKNAPRHFGGTKIERAKTPDRRRIRLRP